MEYMVVRKRKKTNKIMNIKTNTIILVESESDTCFTVNYIIGSFVKLS